MKKWISFLLFVLGISIVACKAFAAIGRPVATPNQVTVLTTKPVSPEVLPAIPFPKSHFTAAPPVPPQPQPSAQSPSIEPLQTTTPPPSFGTPQVAREPSKLLEGGSIISLLVDPQSPATLYALTYTGSIFKSINGGESWSAADNGLPNMLVGALAIDPLKPAILYATTNGSGVFKSTDGGGHWSVANAELPTNESSTLAIDPLRPANIYASTFEGLYKSANSGESWDKVDPGSHHFSAYSLVIDPARPATLYAASANTVYKSTDGGVTWRGGRGGGNRGLRSDTYTTVVVDPRSSDTLYAGTWSGDVFKSMDGGENWSLAGNSFTGSVYDLAIDPHASTTLYVGTNSGVYKSTDGGATWSGPGAGLIDKVFTLAIDPQTPATLYAGTWGHGIYKSADGGQNWVAINTGLTGSIVVTLAFDPQTPAILYAGTYGGGVYKSTDSGQSWIRASAGLFDAMVMVLAIDPQTPAILFAGTEHSGVFNSTDGGETWRAVNAGLVSTDVNALVIDPLTPTTLYAGTDNGVFKSMDGGEKWVSVNRGSPATSVDALAIDPAAPATLYEGMNQGGVYKSTDGGENWNAANNGMADPHVRFLAIDPRSSITVYALTYDGIYKSSIGGENWVAIGNGLPASDFFTLVIDPLAPNTLFALAREGMYKSSNGGEDWGAFNTGLADRAFVTFLATDPLTPAILHVGTFGGNLYSIQADGALNPTLAPTPTFAPSTPLAPNSSVSDWQPVIEAFAQDAVNNTPLAGMTLAIRRQGEPDWIRAYGYADLEASLPASPDTVYQIGSLSMQFTAVAVMQLVERDQLDLHAPIGQYLEGLPEQFQSFTLHQLLTHTSLIYDSAGEMQPKFFGQQEFTSQTLLEELVPSLSLRSVDDPFRFAYGNYILAGLIVEKVSGLSYPDYLNKYVIAPAGLQHTSYCLPPPPGVAKGYFLPEGVLQPLKLNISAVFAAGGLCSTAGDLLQWMSALTSGKVVSPQSYQQIITPAKLTNGTSTDYGYGLMIFQEDNLVIFVSGSEASYVTYLFSFPQKGLTFVLLSNTVKPENDLFGKIWKSLPSLF